MIMSDLPDDTDILLQPQVKSILLPNISPLKGRSIYGGMTALLVCHLERSLLQAKAKHDIQDEAGVTALLLATMIGLSNIVQQLLEHGAKIIQISVTEMV